MAESIYTRKFDRLPEYDEKSRLFAAVDAETKHYPLRSFTWSCNVWLDQLNEGACVGFMWAHELAARPFMWMTTYDDARAIYHRAQYLDEWAGENYEGTSVIAGAKAVMEKINSKGSPLMGEYRWAFGLEDLVRSVGYKGPAGLGVLWRRGMFNTDGQGFIRATGPVAGGHAILCRAVKVIPNDQRKDDIDDLSEVDMDKSYFTLRNSWGRNWGQDGDCKVSFRDMEFLLADQGEACIPVIRAKQR